jgi:sigma54-dependent transcription regulator
MVQDVKAAAYAGLLDGLRASAAECKVQLYRVSIDNIARDAIINLDGITRDDIDAIPRVVLNVFIQLVEQYDVLKDIGVTLQGLSDTGKWFRQNAGRVVVIAADGEMALAPILTEGLVVILKAVMASRKEPEPAM